jgi:hypothetical protein
LAANRSGPQLGVQEQVYHVLVGEGLMEIDGKPAWCASTT